MQRLLAAVALVAASPLGVADYQPPPQHTAEYTIDKGPLTVARATTKFYPAGEFGYLYRLHLRTTGVATLFSGTTIRERSQGRITDDGYRPKRYSYRRRGDDKTEEADIVFDWQAGEVRSRTGDNDWDLEIPPGTLDRVVSPLQLMHDLAVHGEGERRMTYHIADDGELKSYEVRVGERQTVRTGAGTFEVIEVVRENEDGDRRTHLWCAPALEYLPVKIAQHEDGEAAIELRLQSVNGLSSDS